MFIAQKELDCFKSVLGSAEKFLVVSHENPDPDAYGSAGGIGQSLKLYGKQVVWANISGIAEDLKFIAGVGQTLDAVPADYQPDAVLIVDCGDFNRVGESFRKQIEKYETATVINIDHHISNDAYGDINILDFASSSTAEILVALIKAAELPFDKDVASALYAGILTDSGSFRYSSVRPYTFMAALHCVEQGAKPSEIAKALYSNTTLSRIKLQALAMQNMTLHLNGRLAFVAVTEEDYKLCNSSSDETEGLAERARDIGGVIVAVMFKHDRREGELIWKISMRSKSDNVDLSAIAQQFGGGGHKAAAAFRYRKSLEELQQELLKIFATIL